MKITAKGTVAHISSKGKITSVRKVELKWKDLSEKTKPATKRRKAS